MFNINKFSFLILSFEYFVTRLGLESLSGLQLVLVLLLPGRGWKKLRKWEHLRGSEVGLDVSVGLTGMAGFILLQDAEARHANITTKKELGGKRCIISSYAQNYLNKLGFSLSAAQIRGFWEMK